MRRLGLRISTVILLAGLFAASGCKNTGVVQEPSSLSSVTSPSVAKAHVADLDSGRDESREQLKNLTLPDVVSIALKNNPATRAAWADAQAAASKHASAKGTYLPTIDLQGTVSHSKAALQESVTTYGPAASLSYLLLDLGGRGGKVENLYQTFVASGLEHKAAIRDVTLTAEQAYFRYLASKSLLVSFQSGLQEAQANMDSAAGRHKAGLGTIADVLQAKTFYSRAKLDLQSAEGDQSVARGALALSMGLPANIAYDVRDNACDIPIRPVTDKVETLIEQAVSNRADLAAARAMALASEAHVREVRSQNRPSLSASGTFGRTYNSGGDNDNSYAGGIELAVPLFNGFSRGYNTREAEFLAMSQQERKKALEQQVIYEVFSAYFSLQTASQRIQTAGDMLASANQSHEVSAALYKQGLVTITDLLSSQSLLAEARAQQISARLAWLTSLAQLAHDVGTVDMGADNPFSSEIQSQGEKK